MSSLPASALPAKIPDIIPHFCEYAILAFFFIQMFSNPSKSKTMAIGLALLVLLSFLDELHQAFVPSRICSLKDLLFDTLGNLAGLTAYLLARRWSAKSHTHR
jgi:VanZ family protein